MKVFYFSFACDAENGQMLWSWWLGDPLTSSPAVSNGRVFTTYLANGQRLAEHSIGKKHQEASHVMGCFDLYTGKILWQKWIDGDAISAPVVVGTEVYITTFSGTLYSFNTDDGTIGSAIKARATSAPTIVDDQIYYTKRTDKHRGNVKEAIAQKKNYSSMGDELICIDSKAGKIIWRNVFKGDMKKSGGFLATPPIAVNEHILVATLNGNIELYKANTGKLVKRYQLKAPVRFQPIVQDGKIFIGTQDGQVICINTRDPELTGWPTWGRDAAHTGIVH